jgi:hypothetical protein
MKVLFDTKVTLYPVTLKPGPDGDGDARPAEERRGRGRHGD